MELWASDSSLSVSNSSIDVEDKYLPNRQDISRQNSLLYTSGPYENEVSFSSYSSFSDISSTGSPFHQSIPVHEAGKEHNQTAQDGTSTTRATDKYTVSLGEPLVVCHLWNRGLTSLPPQLFQMSQIEWLNISNNRLMQLPPEMLSSLVNLKYLYASYNQISSISMDIRFLHHLKEFSVDHNQITSVPKELFWCTNITHLYLPYNQLYWLPKDIVSLSKLKVLSVSYNNLISIPKELAKLPLEQLQIRNNPFLDQQLEELASQTPNKTAEVLQYLKSIEKVVVPTKKLKEKNESDEEESSEEEDEEDEDELLEWLRVQQLEDIHHLVVTIVENIEDLHSLHDSQLDFLDAEKKNKLMQTVYKTNLNANNNKYGNYMCY